MKPLKKTDWSLYSIVLLIIICIQGSLQHSDRRELHDDYRIDSAEDRRVELKDRRINEEPALNVPQHIQDVRADSRRSRIDAQDIRTDFREIRTELGERREARLSGRFDSRDRMSNVRRERESEQSRQERRFESRLDRARTTLSRSQDRIDSRRNNRETNLFSRRFSAERAESRFNRRTSQERDSRRGRFANERLDRRTVRQPQRFAVRENNQRRYNNERFDNIRELRQNSRDVVKERYNDERSETRESRQNSRAVIREDNHRRQLPERFDKMRSTSSGRGNRLLTHRRQQLNRESSRIFSDRTSDSRREDRSRETEPRVSSRADTTHKLENQVNREEISRSSEDGRRQSSRASEMRVVDDGDKERIRNQLTLNSERGSPVSTSILKNNADVIVSTIQVALVLLLALQMAGNKAKKPFRFDTWTSVFSRVKSA